MIYGVYNNLWNDIEKYCKIMDDIIVNPLKSDENFVISQDTSICKTDYEMKKNNLESNIFHFFDQVNDPKTFSIALFVYRTVTKKKMYDDSCENWTLGFKLCNYLFFISLEYMKKSSRTLWISFNDSKAIEKIFILGYTALKNQQIYNEQYFYEHKTETDKFFDYLKHISNRCGDLHSYQIISEDLQIYLDSKKLSAENIKQNALGKIAEQYISKDDLQNNNSWKKLLSDNLSDPKDDIIIVPIKSFNGCEKRFCDFITMFESNKCCNASDIESELIFSYKTEHLLFVSKKILYDAQMEIESFITWGQYEELTKYYFGKPVDQKTLKSYNRLMTYKIADLLLVNDYIVPMEKWNKMSIPQIEISNYVNDKQQKNELGDLDLIFYSKYTKTLYIIEYKNYQMLVTRNGDLSADISKVEREKTPERVQKRHQFVSDNIDECVKKVFKICYSVQRIKSIILSTKPCYYYYINKAKNYNYMDWIEFEKKVLNKEL